VSKLVVFTTTSRISCAGQSNPAVILCLDDSAAINTDCGRTTIDGVLTSVYKTGNDCECPTWRYVVSYDENLLIDPTVALTAAEVTGIFCKGCLTTWVEDEIACNCDCGGGGGGDCVVEVTTAELNALVLANGLTVGCTYIITDHIQGRVI
jgi:hypothetical protein